MQENPADIWVLTETHDSLAPKGFEAVHAPQRPMHGARVKSRSRWVSIWSRFPIQEITSPNLASERTVAAIVETPIGRWVVYGTVIPWHADRGRMGEQTKVKNWSEHHRVIPIQIEEWRALQEAYPDAGLCVAGDFNTDMGTGRIYGTKRGISLINEGLNSLRLHCPTSPEHLPKNALLRPPIDHIVIPQSWRSRAKVSSAFEGKVGKPRLSDHSGIVIEIG